MTNFKIHSNFFLFFSFFPKVKEWQIDFFHEPLKNVIKYFNQFIHQIKFNVTIFPWTENKKRRKKHTWICRIVQQIKIPSRLICVVNHFVILGSTTIVTTITTTTTTNNLLYYKMHCIVLSMNTYFRCF